MERWMDGEMDGGRDGSMNGEVGRTRAEGRDKSCNITEA